MSAGAGGFLGAMISRLPGGKEAIVMFGTVVVIGVLAYRLKTGRWPL